MNTKKEFTEQEIKDIIKLYTVDKIPILNIAKTFKCGDKRIRQCLLNNSVPIIKGALQTIKDETIDRAIALLDSGKSLKEVSKIVGHSSDVISKKVKQKGYVIINHQNESKFDETIFDVIDTEEKAYWLGFIYADGYISSPLKKGVHKGKNPYAFEISLQISDINHLIKFNNFTKHNKVNIITDIKDPIRPHCKWVVKNKHLWNTLNDLGCIPKKSLILKFPKMSIFSNENLVIPFIRGFFDGDGCLTYCKSGYSKNKVYPRCGFTGTENMLTHIEKILGKTGHIYDSKGFNDEINGITKQLWFNNNDTVYIINLLYNNANIYLDRKYKLYEFFKNGSRSLEEFNELLEGKIGELWDENTEVSSEIAKGSETP